MKFTKAYKRQLHKRMLIAGITVVVMMASLFACLNPLFVSEKKQSVVENSATDSISFINTGNGLGLSVTASSNMGVNSIEVYTGTTQIASYTYTDGKTVHSETISTTNTAAFGASKAYSLVVNGQTTVSTTLTNNRYISDAADMVAFRNSVNNGNIYSGKYVELTKNINLSSVCSTSLGSWTPIGNGTTSFRGVFDGKNHTIQNIYISSTASNIAFFGNLIGGTIQNLTITGNITGTNSSASSYGGLVRSATSNAIIVNCINKVNVTAAGTIAGGIAAIANNTKIIRCANLGTVKITAAGKYNIGGLVGQSGADMIIEESYNSGTVQVTSGSNSRNVGRFSRISVGRNFNNKKLLQYRECK